MRFDLFSSGRLYKALEKAAYPDLPAERTLRDWIKHDSAPEGARLAVARLLSLDTKKEEPPPDWARALADEIRTDLRTNRETIVKALAQRTTRRALEDSEALLRQIRDVLARVERRLEE